MPAKGFKTITVKDNVYDFLFSEWEKSKDKLRLEKGITSFSGYVTYRLSQLIEQEKKHS